MLRFYNTLTRKREEFKPIRKGEVHMYSCGLTVYDYAHIGNLRAYVFVDLLRRWLEYREFDVEHVMNLTDVDDKTIRGMKRENLSLKEYTQRYTEAFFEDLKTLNVKKANIIPKATEHIEDMVRLIKILLEKGYGYKGEDGSIYYDLSKFKDYGKLSKMKVKALKAGARVKVDEYAKEEASDFALWRAWDPEDGDVFWETEFGKGRPGWHIECSAMSMKYLGETLDIHTGGVDNIFPHHENEIAQSEAVTGKEFVNYWLHNEHLLIKGERMGKSLKNFYTLRELLDLKYEPMAVRYLLLSTHYRKQLHFTLEGLKAAQNTLHRLYTFMERLHQSEDGEGGDIKTLLSKTKKNFEDAMDNDLDINGALAVFFDFIREINSLIDAGKLNQEGKNQVSVLMSEFDKALGVLEDFWRQREEKLPKEAEELIQAREEARKTRNWKTADTIRNKLRAMGIIIEDTPQGVKWKRMQQTIDSD